MNPQIKPLAEIFAFDTMVMDLLLSDLSDEEAGRRWRDGEGSSIAFLFGHLLSSRIGLLKRFGETAENPYAELFGGSTSAQDASAYPSLRELMTAWKEVAGRLERTLESVTDEHLKEPAEGLPIPDRTARGAVMFMAYHEAYHVGQIGLMRTEMGKPSMQARFYEAMQKTS